MFFKKIAQKESGLILVVVLWILLILTVFALSVGRGVNLDLLVSRYGIDKLKSYYLAKTAVLVAMEQLANDSKDEETSKFDTLYECGISLDEGQNPEGIFEEVKQADGYFSVSYKLPNNKIIYGLEDEQARINLNGINALNYKVFISFLKLKGIDEEVSKIIASSIVDWRDSNSVITNPFGAEDDYYLSLEEPYHCQNTNFQSMEELLLVKGMTQEILRQIKDHITIFPINSNFLKVNVNTATEEVLQALANAAIPNVPGTSQSDADSLVQKIIDYRKGDDNIIATADDKLVEQNKPDKLGLNTAENALFVYLNNNFFIQQSEQSDYFRINATGTYKDKKVKSHITVVVQRDQESPLYWYEQ